MVVQDIINELVDSEKTLTNPLLKTKVLATKLKNKELLDWVNNELSGYVSDDDVPDYRITISNLIGTFRNGNSLNKNQPLISRGLSSELYEYMNKVHLNSSVQSLESMVKENKSGTLSESLPAEICATISEQYIKQGNPLFNVLNARKECGITAVVQALSEIRSKLLELMLALDEESNTIDINNLGVDEREKLNKIIVQNMSNQIITGDGNIANQGNKNKIKAQINFTKGDKEELKKVLSENGIAVEDIIGLTEIIDEEEPNLELKKPGNKVSAWMKKMLGKSVDGSWQIGIGAAGELLAQVIAKYYGM